MDASGNTRLCFSILFAALLPVAAILPASAQHMGSMAPKPGGSDIVLAGDGTVAPDPWKEAQAQLIARGNQLLLEKQPEAAIREGFDPAIQAYESRYADPGTIYFCARTMPETLLYLADAALAHDKGETAKNAIVLDSSWANAHFGRGYALFELNRFEEAATALERALDLSPRNPLFLSERGNVYRTSADWQKMLESNRAALASIDLASPEDERDAARARALRGEGYALIELGQLKEAEKSFKASLKIEPGNTVALNELEYIKQLRKQAK